MSGWNRQYKRDTHDTTHHKVDNLKNKNPEQLKN